MHEFLRILVSGASGPIGAALSARSESRGMRGHAPGRGRQPVAGSDRLGPGPAAVARSGFRLRRGDSSGRRIHRRPLDRSQEAAHPRQPRQGTGTWREAVAKAAQRPRVFISASAVGYYGDRGDEILREDSPSGEGFAAEICRQWEAAAQPAAQAGIRTVQMRIGVVMSADGGALPKMLPPFRLGLGGRLGNGRQWWSWVSVDDVVGAIQHVLNHERSGPVNTVAPNPVTNAEFTRILASVLRRPAIFPMPAFAVGLIFGEMGEELFLGSQRVEPAKLAASGYQFQHPELKKALKEILQRKYGYFASLRISLRLLRLMLIFESQDQLQRSARRECPPHTCALPHL